MYDQFQRPTGHLGTVIAARMNREHYELTSWGLTHVAINPDFKILDVGCGGGKTVNRLVELAPNGKVYGVDYSPDIVAYASKLNKQDIEQGKVEIAEGQADRTGFPSGIFDLVTAVETYYFWPSLPDAFREILRVLKPCGKLLMINEMVKDGCYDKEKAALIEKVHVHLFTLEEIRIMLQSVGFTNIGIFRKENSAWNAVLAQKPA
ncbi:class I SAM-dependent methyltransferase [Candidatus Bathyarchaeota archaeon]|nr:class I SAM-dependent methyltransferase [Candidatus Bathyarchaeota archaeon]